MGIEQEAQKSMDKKMTQTKIVNLKIKDLQLHQATRVGNHTEAGFNKNKQKDISCEWVSDKYEAVKITMEKIGSSPRVFIMPAACVKCTELD